MATTYLSIVNDVLSRLREDEVATVSATDYSKLIGKFVNDIKQEVEDAWKWTKLRTVITINTSASTQQYAVTGAGERMKILGVYNDTDDVEMKIIPNTYMNSLNYFGTTQEGSPYYYRFADEDSNHDPYVDLWPIPNGVYSIKFNLVVPDAELTDDADTVTHFTHLIKLGAWAKAISERGEDGGVSFAEADAAYRNALADEIIRDTDKVPHEQVWEVN